MNSFPLFKEKEAANLVSQTNAANANYPKISGNYNGVFVKTTTYYIPTPSIINSEVNEVELILTNTNIKSQIITGGENNIANGTNEVKINQLPSFTLQVFSGTLNTTTGEDNNGAKEDLANKFILAYSGTLLANNGIYKQIVETTGTDDLISLVENVVQSSPIYASSGAGNDTPTVTDWRSVDTNCTLPDVQIGTQFWAGCNSTLGTGIEYSDETYCYNYDEDGNGTNDNLGVAGACGTGNYGDSDDNAKDYFESVAGVGGTNGNGDVEVDNIWGKLYTWDQAMGNTGTGACQNGYHLPSDEDWYNLEVALGSTDRSTNGEYSGIQDGRFSDGLGWKLHSEEGKDNTNNIIQAFKLPLAGFRYTDGVTFYSRGNSTTLWSSTSNGADAYIRFFHQHSSPVNRNSDAQTLGFSVRCLKD